MGLLHRPKVLLLDEPTVGIDPWARLNILDVVRQVANAGTTVLYTTHYMDEAQDLCDRIAIIDHGRVLTMRTLHGLISFGQNLAELRGNLVALGGFSLVFCVLAVRSLRID